MSRVFRSYQPNQIWLLPPDPREWLPENHVALFFDEIVSELDLSPFYASYKGVRGGPPYDPRMMVKVWVYAYYHGIQSSRKLEQALYDDVGFRFLSGNQQPNYWTLANFRRLHTNALGNLLAQSVQLADNAGLVKMQHVALDGTKIEANASKHTALSYGRMGEEIERLRKEIARYLQLVEKTDQEEDKTKGNQRPNDLPPALATRQLRLEAIEKARQAKAGQANAVPAEVDTPMYQQAPKTPAQPRTETTTAPKTDGGAEPRVDTRQALELNNAASDEAASIDKDREENHKPVSLAEDLTATEQMVSQPQDEICAESIPNDVAGQNLNLSADQVQCNDESTLQQSTHIPGEAPPTQDKHVLIRHLKIMQHRLTNIEKAKAELEQEAREKLAADQAKRAAVAEQEGREYHPRKNLIDVLPKETAQRCFTDPESRVMPSKRFGYYYGYNAQAIVDVDSQIILAAKVTNQAADSPHLPSMNQQMIENTGIVPKAESADTGYYSEKNLDDLEKWQIESYIPPERISHHEWRIQAQMQEPPPPDADKGEQMRYKLRTPEGRAIYKKRQESVEPTFGQIKEGMGFRRMLQRGLDAANDTWRFVSTVHNMTKVFRARQRLMKA